MSLTVQVREGMVLRILKVLISLTTIAVTIVALFLYTNSFSETPTLTAEAERRRSIQDLKYRQALAQNEVAKAGRESAVLRDQLQQLQTELASIRAQTGNPPSLAVAVKLTKDLAQIRAAVEKNTSLRADADRRINALTIRFEALEETIKSDAMRVISVPLLQKDLLNLQQQTARDLETIRGESNRLYDLMKLLIGLMGLISFGLLGTAVGNLFKREKEVSTPPSAETTA